MRSTGTKLRHGFTLMEILIVVVILGILAAIVIPSFASATEDTRRAAFTQDLRAFETGILRYEVDHGQFPPDGSSGTVPSGLEDYVDGGKWQRGSPIGGAWDNETDDVLAVGMGIHFDGTGQTRDNTYMADIDAMLDDGDVTTGSFRAYGDRYYRVILP